MVIGVKRWRRKPQTIEAIQWGGSAADATRVINWILSEGGTARYHEARSEAITPYRPDDINSIEHPEYIAVDSLEGTVQCDPGCYVVKGIRGEFYCVRADIFRDLYEPV